MKYIAFSHLACLAVGVLIGTVIAGREVSAQRDPIFTSHSISFTTDWNTDLDTGWDTGWNEEEFADIFHTTHGYESEKKKFGFSEGRPTTLFDTLNPPGQVQPKCKPCRCRRVVTVNTTGHEICPSYEYECVPEE